MATDAQIIEALRQVYLPGVSLDIVSLGMVKNVKTMGGVAALTLELPPQASMQKAALEERVRAALKELGSLTDVAIHTTVGDDRDLPKGPAPKSGIKHIVAIGSGKGGVGKSTVSANLALALARTGAKVGLLDADIYGPSIPLIMGAQGEKPAVVNEKLVPIVRHGVKLMSMGFLLPNPEDPVVWRGPMLASALKQFMKDVEWGELDYLLIDLPPGTGDVPLTMVQAIPLKGAIIVLTPQPVAAAIGLKTLRMLQQTKTRILGIIENMSHFTCPHCEEETDIFSRGGGRKIAEAEGVPFLGEIPLDPKIRATSDAGAPVVAVEPGSPQAKSFIDLAESLMQTLEAGSPA
jgi:ATP-binding protein involved in chromosome partitioning